MQEFFDYIFYRIYTAAKSKGDTAAETNGTLLLSLLQFFTLLDLMVFLRLIFEFPLPPNGVFIAMLILIPIYNWFRYERTVNIQEFERKWDKENEKIKHRNRLLINIYMGSSFLIIFTYGLLKRFESVT